MKLRCTTNSIRLRLRKSDLQELSDKQSISDAIAFPNGASISYTLSINASDFIEATFENNEIIISLPKNKATNWIKSSIVSIEANLTLQDENKLHILIEKDFPCKDREEENKEDTFWELSPENNSC